jgi:formyl-CoA transferase
LSHLGIPCGVVRNVAEACDIDGLAERGLFMPTSVADAQPQSPQPRYVNAGFVFAADGPGMAGNAPRLAEHTREVLADLGYGEYEIQQLIDAGAASVAGAIRPVQ